MKLMNNKFLDKLLKQLHSKNLPTTVEEKFIKIGEPACEYLIEKLDDCQLTDYQVINAIAILVKMRYLVNTAIVIEKILYFTRDNRLKIRSIASRTAIALLRQSEACGTPSFQIERESLKIYIEQALSMGLDPSSTSYTNDFLKENI